MLGKNKFNLKNFGEGNGINDCDGRHKNYSRKTFFLKENYPGYGERLVYFLAICLHLDPNIDLDIALKLRPYGGIIGIDNSSPDKDFNFF